MTKLRRLRVEGNLSQREVGVAVGLSGNAIGEIERRVNGTRPPYQAAISKYFGLPVGHLFDQNGRALLDTDDPIPGNVDASADTFGADSSDGDWIRCDVAASISGRSLSTIEHQAFNGSCPVRKRWLRYKRQEVQVQGPDGKVETVFVVVVDRKSLMDLMNANPYHKAESQWMKAIAEPKPSKPKQMDLFDDPAWIAKAAKSNPAILNQLQSILNEMKRNN